MDERLAFLSLSLAALLAAGCGSSAPSYAPARMNRPATGASTASSQTAPQQPETYRPTAARYFSSAFIYLANNVARQLVHFEVVEGMGVMEGDMLLGPATLVPFRYGTPPRPAGSIQGAVAIRDRTDLWPRGEIPYAIEPSVSAQKVEWINWAVSHINTTSLKLRPRVGDNDYVTFRDNGEGSGCHSYVGRVGGAQEIQLGDCGRGSVVHEILHAAGFFHEQSRDDRDDYVTIMWDEIVPDFRWNFEKTGGRGEGIGPYDYQSIMHYSMRAFSRTGKPTIVPRIPNASIGQRDGLSPGDKAAIQTLYGNGTPQLPLPSSPPLTIPGTNFPFPMTGLPLPSLPFPLPNLPFPTNIPALTAPIAPAPAPAPAPAGPISFAGSYSSSRGPMHCSENSAMVACGFQDGNAQGRLDCMKDAANVTLSCTWLTFLPRPGTGRASLKRTSNADRNLTGTWGHFLSDADGGSWDATRQ